MDVPPHPETTDAFVELVTKAHEYLMAHQDRLEREFGLGHHDRWDWNQDTGTIVFSTGGQPQVIADVRFVGSTSTKTQSWLWSWANEAIERDLSRDLLEVRGYGEAHAIGHLTSKKWTGDDVDGWEMTSIAAYILQAEGAYRTQRDEGGFTYMLLDRVRHVSGESI